MLGDHGQWDKQVPHRSSTEVPLVVAGPGIESGTRDRALVSLIDLGPTFLELAGLDAPSDVDARSFVPVLAGRARSHREHVRSGLLGWRMVDDGRYKLVRGSGPATTFNRAFGPEPLLFDLDDDPWEDRNLAASMPQVVARLSELLPPVPAAGQPG
jgi:arylsulfatase A-like enzyme